MNSARRYSLLELILVMIVIVTVGALTLPRVAGSLKLGRLRAQARTMIGLCQLAKIKAVEEGRATVLSYDPELRELRLTRRRSPLAEPEGDDPELEPPSEDESWSRPQPLEEEVEIVEIEVGSTNEGEGELAEEGEPVQLTFRPDGSSDAARIVFQAGEDRITVRLFADLALARIRPDAEEAAE